SIMRPSSERQLKIECNVEPRFFTMT
ncbi:unnamed protein product, partial [Rotaria sp. Silwood2]